MFLLFYFLKLVTMTDTSIVATPTMNDVSNATTTATRTSASIANTTTTATTITAATAYDHHYYNYYGTGLIVWLVDCVCVCVWWLFFLIHGDGGTCFWCRQAHIMGQRIGKGGRTMPREKTMHARRAEFKTCQNQLDRTKLHKHAR